MRRQCHQVADTARAHFAARHLEEKKQNRTSLGYSGRYAIPLSFSSLAATVVPETFFLSWGIRRVLRASTAGGEDVATLWLFRIFDHQQRTNLSHLQSYVWHFLKGDDPSLYSRMRSKGSSFIFEGLVGFAIDMSVPVAKLRKAKAVIFEGFAR